MTSMDGLVDFLRARLDEVERDSRDLLAREGQGLVVLRLARERLAEVEAKRRIAALHVMSTHNGHAYCETCHVDDGMIYGPGGHCDTLRLLALPYADHAQYRQEWRPQ